MENQQNKEKVQKLIQTKSYRRNSTATSPMVLLENWKRTVGQSFKHIRSLARRIIVQDVTYSGTHSSDSRSSYRVGHGWVYYLPRGEIFHFPALLRPHELLYYPKHCRTTYAAYCKRHSARFTQQYEPDRITNCYRHIKKFRCYVEHLTTDQ